QGRRDRRGRRRHSWRCDWQQRRQEDSQEAPDLIRLRGPRAANGEGESPTRLLFGVTRSIPLPRRHSAGIFPRFPQPDYMAKEEPIQLEGQVTDVLPNATFRVQLTNGHSVLATLGGNMRRFRIRVLKGDRVTIEVSP